MKIISPFKDYYDSVSHQYLDPLIRYMREQTVHDLSEKRRSLTSVHEYLVTAGDNRLSIKTSFLGFCGEIYPLVIVSWQENRNGIAKGIQLGLYTKEEAMEFLKSFGIILEESRRAWRGWNIGFSASSLTRHFELTESKDLLKSYFRQLNVPAFLVLEDSRKITLITNPFLKALSFAKIKDPFTAHQDLSTYIPGFLLKPENPTIEISNADKIHKHGFDKWSFRKLPQKR